MGSDLKIIREIKDIKVFLTSCRFAKANMGHRCNKGSKCPNFVYGTLIRDTDPHIVGWCNDVNTIEKRAVAWAKMLKDTKDKPSPSKKMNTIPDLSLIRKQGSETYPGYV